MLIAYIACVPRPALMSNSKAVLLSMRSVHVNADVKGRSLNRSIADQSCCSRFDSSLPIAINNMSTFL